MSDTRVRAAERLARQVGGNADDRAFHERVRAGLISEDALVLAAYCGHVPSLQLISYQPGTGCGALAPDFNRTRDAGYPGAGLLIACQWHTPGSKYPHGTAYHHAFTWADVHGDGSGQPFGAGSSWPASTECWISGLRRWPLTHKLACTFLMPRPCDRSHEPGPRHEYCIEEYLRGLGDLAQPRIDGVKQLLLRRAIWA